MDGKDSARPRDTDCMSKKRSLAEAVRMSAAIVGVLFLVKGFELVSGLSLEAYGILPRTREGLMGILWSPFLHANLPHLLSNASPLFVLLILLLSNPRYRPWRALLLIWIASGLGTWLIGRESVHVGASSVIFGLIGYLIAAAFFLRSWMSFFIAAAVFLLYGGGILSGITPQAGPISWEGHLCGVIAGIWTAGNLRK
jgi:membrane associated rhomboid family serine protease